ncbi:MAG: DUF4105 domain-containing protein [Bacteroidales bacterium]|jgi:hypothetical protein|nr:DUF4105 domain-containing protein [Bacteroidales bacterium]OQB65676.1 MAG: hypothetical protein BWX96_00260 [Bacteroidetes bacterium ADurb.Bin145]HOU02130.1 DUF4105 domain-containing protein [Bacteroidales bacterium]HQK67502.1 DUF4105 domain-containing protein [Bacteroidales bacterium]
MRKAGIYFTLILLLFSAKLVAQDVTDIKVYLITCGPGTETYSIYGHSALRIVVPESGSDIVYNWGVFDFNTPHFVWKFAKGRLYYMLAATTFERFQQEYFLEHRWMQVQEINLEPEEKIRLMQLIAENLQPENVEYLYDFFYDNCSTRIRDLLEKVLGKNLMYPPDDPKQVFSFRIMAGNYQRIYPWLNAGIDLILGTPCEKKAHFRDRMFLPIEMQKGLSESLLRRSGRMVPLLTNPETVLSFDESQKKNAFHKSPTFAFSLLLIAVVIFFALIKNKKAARIADIIIFLFFSCLALFMLFSNFMTDHWQLKRNLNILWLSPFLLVCLAAVILKKEWFTWFRIVFILSLLSFAIQIIFPGGFNSAFIPLILILAHRSSARSGFSWNPLSMDSF